MLRVRGSTKLHYVAYVITIVISISCMMNYDLQIIIVHIIRNIFHVKRKKRKVEAYKFLVTYLCFEISNRNRYIIDIHLLSYFKHKRANINKSSPDKLLFRKVKHNSKHNIIKLHLQFILNTFVPSHVITTCK